MDKSRLHQAITEKIAADVELQTRAALMARDEATHEESKPQNQYDMHSQEAAYLAEGQAKLAAELHESLNVYRNLTLPAFAAGDPIGIGALVTLEADDRRSFYFVGPRNGGLEIELDSTVVIVVTPQSPLGRQLVGQRVGDPVELPGRGKPVPHRIVAVE